MRPTRPGHLMDLDEWSALPEDSERRYELAEGVLQVAARPILRHQKLLLRLATQLDAAGRFSVLPEHTGTADLAPGVTLDLAALDR